jgi:thiol:disulfide interchange protein
MKIVLVSVIAILVVYGLLSFRKPNSVETTNTKGIQFFEGTFKQALLEAKDLKRPIFLDVYATWCGPCKQLKKTTFKDEAVGNYFNANFINVAIDGESPEGQELIRKYNIRAYPSLLIVDSSGEVKTRTVGFLEPHILINFGKRIIP